MITVIRSSDGSGSVIFDLMQASHTLPVCRILIDEKLGAIKELMDLTGENIVRLSHLKDDINALLSQNAPLFYLEGDDEVIEALKVVDQQAFTFVVLAHDREIPENKAVVEWLN